MKVILGRGIPSTRWPNALLGQASRSIGRAPTWTRLAAPAILLVAAVFSLGTRPAVFAGAKELSGGSISTHFYTAAFPGGRLHLTAPDGAPLLDEIPPELCLGAPHVEPTNLVPNADLGQEAANGAPAGWTIGKPYITKAPAGPNQPSALIWDLAAPDDPVARGVDTPPIAATGAPRYTVAFAWKGTKRDGESVEVHLLTWTDSQERGSRKDLLIDRLMLTSDAGQETSGVVSVPILVPAEVRSFRIGFRATGDFVGSFELSNVAVRPITCPRPDTSPAAVTVEPPTVDAQVVEVTRAWGPAQIRENWTFSRNTPVIRLATRVTYNRPTYVTSERFAFSTPLRGARTLGRDLRAVPIAADESYVGDPLSPRVLDVPDRLLVSGDGAQSTLIHTQDQATVFGAYSDLDLNHPLQLFVRDGDGAMRDYSQTYRAAGETSSAGLEIVVGPHHPPIALARQPNGYVATIALSEHADGASLPDSEAVNFGTSDHSDPAYGKEGFIGHRLAYTKSAFALSAAGSPDATMEDPAYLDHLKRLAAAGVEIVPHTISDQTDDLVRVERGLRMFEQFGARTWIDHKNGDGRGKFESVTSEGLLVNSPSRVIDLLREHGYTYAWSSIDYDVYPDNIDLLRPDQPSAYRALVFPLHRNDGTITVPPGFYFWSTAIPRLDPEDYLTPENVWRLVADHGVFVAHDYYPRARNEGHVFTTSNGVVRITPAFEADLAGIAAAHDEGQVWVPTISQLLDYWTGLMAVRVHDLGGDRYDLVNTGTRAIDGVTISLPSDATAAKVDGRTVTMSNHQIILPNLAPRKTVRIELGFSISFVGE